MSGKRRRRAAEPVAPPAAGPFKRARLCDQVNHFFVHHDIAFIMGETRECPLADALVNAAHPGSGPLDDFISFHFDYEELFYPQATLLSIIKANSNLSSAKTHVWAFAKALVERMRMSGALERYQRTTREVAELIAELKEATDTLDANIREDAEHTIVPLLARLNERSGREYEVIIRHTILSMKYA